MSICTVLGCDVDLTQAMPHSCHKVITYVLSVPSGYTLTPVVEEVGHREMGLDGGFE
eukprot:m.363602 g.363602  ORF g.363602 m.363602 type:complete len:57 (-) comp23094_c0_seq1:734-904(-)